MTRTASHERRAMIGGIGRARHDEIVAELVISPGTVKAMSCAKLGAANRIGIAMWCGRPDW